MPIPSISSFQILIISVSILQVNCYRVQPFKIIVHKVCREKRVSDIYECFSFVTDPFNFNASVAEIDALDNRQQAVMGACIISNDKTYLDKKYSMVEALVLEYTKLQLIDVTREWL